MNPENNQNPQESGGSNDYQSINDRLNSYKVTLTNAKLPALQPILSRRGYSIPVIDAALVQLAQVQQLNETQKTEYGEAYHATRVFNEHRNLLHDDYIEHVEVSRVVFKRDIEAQTALGLIGRRRKTQSEYIMQGLQFYRNAQSKEAFKTALAAKGISGTDLEQGQLAFEQLQQYMAAQQKENGEAQKATNDRDEALDAFEDWMSDFRKTARASLRRFPQLMEQLGMIDPS